jgi:small subunit ribosomal protein S15
MTKEKKADWVKIKPEEVEKIVIDLAKKGNSPEKIGLILRDQHGIPKSKIFGKKISQILREKNLYVNPVEKNLTVKIENLKSHFTKNKHDYSSQRKIIKHSAALRKLQKIASKNQ